MLRVRWCKNRGNDEEIQHLTPLSPPFSLSPDRGPDEFITAVMGLQYRPKISLSNLARAEREFIAEGQSFKVQKAFKETYDSSHAVLALKTPSFSDSLATDGAHWRRMWLEVKSLIHPPLAAHPNIVDLLAIGWESGLSSTNTEIEWPVLAMPYASYGTLDKFQWSPEATRDKKISVCLDVALGLNALHECGIVHGDLKSENVLIFAGDSGPVAKLCDFGCAIADPRSLGSLVGGSQPWNCPEWKEVIGKDNLPLTDNYSFGLLVWRTFCENMRPYQDLSCFAQTPHLSTDDIDQLKRQPNDEFLTEIKKSLAITSLEATEKDKFEQVFGHTIKLLPRERNLGAAIQKLEELSNPKFVYLYLSVQLHEDDLIFQ